MIKLNEVKILEEMITQTLNVFVSYYPVIMSIFWIVGSLFFYLKRENTSPKKQDKITILVPAYNEEETIEMSVESLINLTYSDYEIMLINDCSTDKTLEKMKCLQKKYCEERQLTLVNLEKNCGKAKALNFALKKVETKYLLVVDSDAHLAPNALEKLMESMGQDEKIGAVTGRPIIRNRTTLLGRLQTLEYLGIIERIKEAQSFFFDQIMTVSGVLVLYRVKALNEIGGWTEETMTEDIDATWKLYQKNWRVVYQPKAITWILAPEKIRNLIKQRSRWAIGGFEMLLSNKTLLFKGSWSEKCLLVEMLLSHIWSWLFLISVGQYIYYISLTHALKINGTLMLLYVAVACIQFFMGIRRSLKDAQLKASDYLVLPGYLLYYWLINLMTALYAEWAVLMKKTSHGKWESPDRGI